MAAHQAPSSLGFSRKEHWSGLPCPSPMHESEKWKWSRSVMSNSDSLRPHGLQPTRLLRPWDFPGKNTGVGCHRILGETPGVTGKFGLGIRNEAGQRLIEFCQQNAVVMANTLFQKHKSKNQWNRHWRNNKMKINDTKSKLFGKKSVKLIKLKLDWSRKKENIKDQNRVLPREHTGHSKYTLPTTQETTLHMDITRWSILKSNWL